MNEKYKMMGRDVGEHTCSLGHQHSIFVEYRWETKMFTIEKEEFPDKESFEWDKQKILDLLEKQSCYFSEKGYHNVAPSELAGFEHDNNCSNAINFPICKNCWKEKWDNYLQYEEEQFSSLDYYLDLMGLKPDKEKDELIYCWVLADYPKVGKHNYEKWSKFDLECIAEFEKKLMNEDNIKVDKGE